MRVLNLALIILATGCGDSSGPSRPTIELSTAQTWGLPMPLSLVAQAPDLIVSGTIDVNEPCYDFSASLGAVRDTLIAWLRADRRDGHCPQELARFAYTLTISGLEHGVQPLRVVYDYRGPPTFVQVAFEGAIDIQ